MKKFLVAISFLTISVLLNGCLVFHKVSYTVQPNGAKGGTATLYFEDIKSDAIGNKEFEEDKNALFEYMLSSDEFISEMKKEGKKIKSRELYVDNNKLFGKIVFSYDKISEVEGMQYQDGFYFLTIPPTDSVISTNGVVVPSKDHKRIMWDKSIKELKFEMLSDAPKAGLRELAPFYTKE
ncbi:MAG: hypothetical protein KF721_01665 [Ignavibacteriaceae bacterium]|nr:hypothetical protein [Ignavibacteriaceae bacterium]